MACEHLNILNTYNLYKFVHSARDKFNRVTIHVGQRLGVKTWDEEWNNKVKEKGSGVDK